MNQTTKIEPEMDEFVKGVGESLTPVRHKIVIALAKEREKTKGGVFIPDETRDREHVAEVCGLVVMIGPDAFNDERRFPSGATFKVGDWVMMRSYQGTRFELNNFPGQEFRLVDDDVIEAVVATPELVKRK